MKVESAVEEVIDL